MKGLKNVKVYIKNVGIVKTNIGIENGRISKLMLKQDGRVVYNYDRGDDVEPQTSEAEKSLAILLHEYN